MPGRGQPWKGVGKGNPDRIGSGAIKDGSITEADLDSSVTSKLNSGSGYNLVEEEGTPLTQRSELNFVGDGVVASDDGEKTVVTIAGGGGSEFVPNLDTCAWFDDFFYNDVNNGGGTPEIWLEATKYFLRGNGTPTVTTSGDHGSISLGTGATATAGDFTQLLTSDDGATIITLIDDVKVEFALKTPDFTSTINLAGLVDIGGSIDPDTTLALVIAGVEFGIMFGYDPAVASGNWQCITINDFTSTIVDSGVNQDNNIRAKLRIEYNDSVPNAVFKIDGATVATITTNIPQGRDAYMFTSVNTKVSGGGGRKMTLDYWAQSTARPD